MRRKVINNNKDMTLRWSDLTPNAQRRVAGRLPAADAASLARADAATSASLRPYLASAGAMRASLARASARRASRRADAAETAAIAGMLDALERYARDPHAIRWRGRPHSYLGTLAFTRSEPHGPFDLALLRQADELDPGRVDELEPVLFQVVTSSPSRVAAVGTLEGGAPAITKVVAVDREAHFTASEARLLRQLHRRAWGRAAMVPAGAAGGGGGGDWNWLPDHRHRALRAFAPSPGYAASLRLGARRGSGR